MKFFYRLEQKYGRYAIRNLMYYIIIMYAFGLMLSILSPNFYDTYLCLNMAYVFKGQIWRLVTFLISPPTLGSDPISAIFFGLIALSLYYSIGQSLERMWGSFRFNVYFFMGVLGNILAALVGFVFFEPGWILTTEFLNFSLFLAFAITFPDIQFLLFFVIPVKVKWLAAAECAIYLYLLIKGGASTRCEIIISLLNVIVFFLLTRKTWKFNPKEIKRKQKFRSQMKMAAPGQARHRCAVCGRTEKDGVNLEFRYCSRCEGNYEYCQDHLYTHIHVTGDSQKP